MVENFGGFEVRHRQLFFHDLRNFCNRWRGHLRRQVIQHSHLRLKCHFSQDRGFSVGRRHHQRQQGSIQAHGIRRLPERVRLPARGLARRNVVRPAAEGPQRVGRKLQQTRVHGLLLSQPGIEQLLHRPGGLTKIVQPHHPRTALERVKGTPQCGLLTQVARIVLQHLDRSQTIDYHLARLFQEDLQQFVLDLRHLRRGWCGRCRSHWQGRRLAACYSGQIERNIRGQRIRLYGSQWLSGGRCGHVRQRRQRTEIGRLAERLLHRKTRHHVRQGNGRPLLQLGRSLFQSIRGTRPTLARENAQLAQFLVIHKQLARHGALVAEHVDQEAQGAQAVAQFLEHALAV